MSKRPPLTLADPRRMLKKTIEGLSHRHRTWQVFADFCEMSAITLHNGVHLGTLRDEREQHYLKIVSKYEREEAEQFPYAFACLCECLEAGFDDVLGSLFMELDLGSHWHGQFFTPYSVASMMARMTFDPASMEGRDFITAQEPACGAGGMMIAFADAMRAAGHNPQRQLHATLVDVDPLCVHMAYVQMSLLGIPAQVVHGNTLSLEQWSVWYTPMHVLGLWGARLRRQADLSERASEAMSAPQARESEAGVALLPLESQSLSVTVCETLCDQPSDADVEREQLSLF